MTTNTSCTSAIGTNSCLSPLVAMIQDESGSNSSSFHSKSPNSNTKGSTVTDPPVVSVIISAAATVCVCVCVCVCVVGISLERIQREASLLAGGLTEGGIVEGSTNAACVAATPPLSAKQDVDPAASCFQGPSGSPLLVPSTTHRQGWKSLAGPRAAASPGDPQSGWFNWRLNFKGTIQLNLSFEHQDSG